MKIRMKVFIYLVGSSLFENKFTICLSCVNYSEWIVIISQPVTVAETKDGTPTGSGVRPLPVAEGMASRVIV